MATIPDEPQTDLEQYLNRIATGDGEYPAEPHTNVEQYLNYIIENGIGGGEARVVDELPAEGEPGYIYLVLKETTKEGDIYDEYIWALQQDGETYGWEHLGATNEVSIKLYDSEGDNTDGAMTQRAATAIKGLAKELTTADYNYPTNNPSRIAAWLLEPGVYIRQNSSPEVYWNSMTVIPTNPRILIVSDNYLSAPSEAVHVLAVGVGGELVVYSCSESSANYGFVVSDSLTQTSTTKALAARQGKILNDKIGGDLSNLTTTDKSSLINAINELAGQLAGVETLLSQINNGGNS